MYINTVILVLPPRPLLAVPNVTAHPSTASVAYDFILFCVAVWPVTFPKT